MGVNLDRWTWLKLIEVILVIICLVFKRVTDDEAFSLRLYLQKLSREWSLLNNITWSRVGAAVADATFGGYLIITAALFIGRLTGELPTHKRVTELVLLGIGSILFIAMGSLSFAALDSVPQDLVDNAAIVGTVSLVTGALFLLDMGGPKAKKPTEAQPKSKKATKPKSVEPKSISQHVNDIEKQIEQSERTHFDRYDPQKSFKESKNNGIRNGRARHDGVVLDVEGTKNMKGYQQMKDDFPRKFGIYGKDVVDGDGSETDETDDLRIPPKMEQHSPVWSNIRKGQYGRYDIISSPIVLPKQKEREEDRPPSRPGEPGYVQYTAQHWGETKSKTPRHSPTEV
ncbi:uncharacterized protein LOC108917988 [Anoplophora glabripennis]|uniref:uncharacterized protein LOC108917988 n=1 Tax=Anoplophora glabripennis TaxID=217634 RepID=UPI000873A608|nr:uncharacterized protein LOC108917988 [Anoplophora glabripennis]